TASGTLLPVDAAAAHSEQIRSITPPRRRPLLRLLPLPPPAESPKMDWQGQKLAEMLMQLLLVASAVAAFVVGYAMADFQLMLLVYAGGVVLTALVTVPNWPFFNRHPLKWLDAAEADRHPRPQVSATPSTVGKKKAGKNK
ncbi:Os12g0438900, partial [Oryza sativa Japonica Group]